MYARFVTMKSTPDKRVEAEALADMLTGIVKGLTGFISIHFLISKDETQYGSFSLWETQENALAAAEVMRGKGGSAIQRIALEAPNVTVFEVYQTKG